MKGNELERNQIHEELNPFKAKNQKSGSEEEKVQDNLYVGNNDIKNSGFEEGELRMNLDLNENKVLIDESIKYKTLNKLINNSTIKSKQSISPAKPKITNCEVYSKI